MRPSLTKISPSARSVRRVATLVFENLSASRDSCLVRSPHSFLFPLCSKFALDLHEDQPVNRVIWRSATLIKYVCQDSAYRGWRLVDTLSGALGAFWFEAPILTSLRFLIGASYPDVMYVCDRGTKCLTPTIVVDEMTIWQWSIDQRRVSSCQQHPQQKLTWRTTLNRINPYQ